MRSERQANGASTIVEMAKRWLDGAKFVTCVREKRTDPFATTLYAKLYYRMLRWLVVKDYPDGGYDLALMDKVMLPHMQSSGKNINPNVFAFWLGFKPVTIPYERRKREHGKSRWTFRKKLKFFLDTMLGFSIVPLRIITLIRPATGSQAPPASTHSRVSKGRCAATRQDLPPPASTNSRQPSASRPSRQPASRSSRQRDRIVCERAPGRVGQRKAPTVKAPSCASAGESAMTAQEPG